MALLFKSGDDWSRSIIDNIFNECAIIAEEEMEIDTYPNQLEIVSAEMMLDAYSSVGLPVNYNHWSYGKDFMRNWEEYKKGRTGLAYELVINSNPCINYLMEENDATMQMLVIAHAAFGHNHYFKNNYMFKQFTDPEGIVDYMDFAKKFILTCEEKHGIQEVESILDAAHSLSNHGIDKYIRRAKKRMNEEQFVLQEKIKAEEEMRHYDDVFAKTVLKKKKEKKRDEILLEPQENILYFIEKKSPTLQPWEREIVRIVRMVSQYFYPQSQTKVANEGFACFTHYYIVNRLFEKGFIDEGTMQSFHHSHTNVVNQPEYYKKWFSGINPYALGYAIFRDIKRICDNPTAEDKEWFPNLYKMRWQDAVKDAVANYKDDSFISQLLSPKVIRDLKLFGVKYDSKNEQFVVQDIHNEIGYKEVRENLSKLNNRINYVPDIQVIEANMKGDRMLVLQYFPYENRPIETKWAEKTLTYAKKLWGYDVVLRRS